MVEKARLGDKECLSRLAELARGPLNQYVLRLTLDRDVAQDIVQEVVLEMFRLFGKLKKAERFWSWLYGIAFNKVRSHYGEKWRHRTVTLSADGFENHAATTDDALAEMVGREFKQIVLKSMHELEPRHRAVLTMRCYDRMAYSEIATIMGSSEFAVRSLFYRAKKALAGKLSAHGLGKSSLLAALILFGKMTATSEASAAGVSITASTLKVGAAASVAAAMTGKTAVISVAAVGLIAGGSVVMTSGTDAQNRAANQHQDRQTALSHVPGPGGATAVDAAECWYFFPEGPSEPVMIRLISSEGSNAQSRCLSLQNAHANYRRERNGVCMTNHRMYNDDLSVMRLPTDSHDFDAFLSEVEGRPDSVEYIPNTDRGLLVICRFDGRQGSGTWRVHRHLTALEEQYFQVDWPQSAETVDNRDRVHKQGWTYFTIEGRLNGRDVAGKGRMPFVYHTSRRFAPWLKLRIAGGPTIIDTPRQACVYDEAGRPIAAYPGGSFFKGLGRPWMGLHTIDTIRRDAADRRITFESEYVQNKTKAKIVLDCGRLEITYLINLDRDIIEKIAFSSSGCGGADIEGELTLTCLEDSGQAGDELAAPRHKTSTRRRQQPPGLLWLVNLAEGGLPAKQ